MKTKLQHRPWTAWKGKGDAVKTMDLALPYYLSRRGKYVHRVRYGYHFWRDGKYTHAAVTFWCGNNGFIGHKGRLLATVPPGAVLCATCEGRAIGAGQNGSRRINGREVCYSPRRKAL